MHWFQVADTKVGREGGLYSTITAYTTSSLPLWVHVSRAEVCGILSYLYTIWIRYQRAANERNILHGTFIS